LDDSNFKGYFRLGQAFAGCDEYELAKINLYKAARMDPKNKEIRKEIEDVNKKLETAPKNENLSLLEKIVVQKEGKFLTIKKTISQISDVVIKFAIPNYIKLTRKSREERRANKNDLEKYIQICDEYSQNIEEIIDHAQKEVLRAIKIEGSVWDDSNQHYLNQNNQTILNLYADLPNKLKHSLPSSKKPTLDETKAILEIFIKALDNEEENSQLLNLMKTPEEALTMVQNRAYDVVYEEHAIEEEEIFHTMKEYAKNREIEPLIGRIQQILHTLMMNFDMY